MVKQTTDVRVPAQYSLQQWWPGAIAQSENPVCRLPGTAQLVAAPSGWRNSGS